MVNDIERYINFSTATNDSIEVSENMKAIKALNIIYKKSFMYKNTNGVYKILFHKKKFKHH